MSFRRWLPVIALLAILGVAYGPVFEAGFCPWDDQLYTADNPLVREGLSVPGAVRAFSSSWENNWSPVFWIALAAQVSWGGGVRPEVFHAVSVGLGLLNAVLLIVCLRRLGVTFAASLVAAALFSFHPLRVEAVAWISAQKHLLAATGVLTALLCHLEATRRDSSGWRIASVAAFAASLMASQIGVGFPVFVFLLEAGRFGPGEHRWIQAGKRSAFFFLLALGAAAATLWVNWRPSAQAVAWFDHPLPHRALQALGSMGWQAVAVFWPWNLATFYPWPARTIIPYAVVGTGVILAAVRVGWKNRHCGRIFLPGLAGFFACFVPVSGLLAIPITFTADRLSYVPSLFLAMALGAALDKGIQKGRMWPVFLCGAWALALAGLTFRQAAFWKDEGAIVARTLSLYPESVPAQINQATLEGMKGNTEEALRRFRRIRAEEPLHEVVWSNEMALLKKAGRQQEAIEAGIEGVRQIPRSVTLNYQLGLELAEAHRPKEALRYFRRARELSPQSVQPAYQCARVLVQLGEVKEAIAIFQLLELSLQGDPAYWEIRGEAHDRNGDWQSAEQARDTAAILRSGQKSTP